MANVITGVDLTGSNFPTKAELDELWDKGCRIVSSYISYSSWKDITAAQIKTLHDYRRDASSTYGFGVLLNFESTADRALSGHAAGLYDGQTVRQRIEGFFSTLSYRPRNKLTVPFSVDFPATSAQYPTIDAYLLGAQEGLTTEFLAGDYGDFDLVRHTAAAGTSHFEWQCYAWSNGQFASGVADFYQWLNNQTLVGGHAVDFDQIITDGKSPVGAWYGPTHPLNVGTENDEMPLSQADIQAVADAVWAARRQDGDGNDWQMGTYVVNTRHNTASIGEAVRNVQASVDAVTKALTAAGSGVLARVAALQAAVAPLGGAIAKIPTTVPDVALDAAAVATQVAQNLNLDGVTDAVVAKVSALTWKAGQ